MPWWATAYMAAYAVLCIIAAGVDLKGQQRRGWHVALDVIAAAVLIAFAADWWRGLFVSRFGPWAAVVLALVLGWDVYSTSRDIAEIEYDHDLTPQANARAEWAAVVVTGLMMAPLYALAIAGAVQAWRAA